MSFPSKLPTYILTSYNGRPVNETYGFKIQKIITRDFLDLGKAIKDIGNLETDVCYILDIQSIIREHIEFLKIGQIVSPFASGVVIQGFINHLDVKERTEKNLETIIYLNPPIFSYPMSDIDLAVQEFYAHFEDRVLDWQLIFKVAKMNTLASCGYTRSCKWIKDKPNQVWGFERTLLNGHHLIQHESMVMGWTIGIHCCLYQMSIGRKLQPQEIYSFLRYPN